MASSTIQRVYKFLPIVSAAWLSFQPGIIQANFVTTTVLMGLIGAAFRSDRLRSMLSLPPKPQPPKGDNTLKLVEHLAPTQTDGGTTRYVYDKSAAAAIEKAKATKTKAAAEAAEFGDDTNEDKNFIDRRLRSVKRAFWRIKNNPMAVTGKKQYEQSKIASQIQERKERERAYEQRRRERLKWRG